MDSDEQGKNHAPLAFLSGLFIPVLVLSLIFGSSLVGAAALMLGVLAVVLTTLPNTRQNLSTALSGRATRQSAGLIIPILAVVGIFGSDQLMVVVLAMAVVALLVMALNSRQESTKTVQADLLSLSEVPALPDQASGEMISTIDIRALCRGLPASVSGEVMSTVDHLELVASQAGQSGDTRRAYSARQGLSDYLPNTVNTWKELPENERNPAELQRALQQIRDIAGENEQNADTTRKAWEIQQRFLDSRADKKG